MEKRPRKQLFSQPNTDAKQIDTSGFKPKQTPTKQDDEIGRNIGEQQGFSTRHSTSAQVDDKPLDGRRLRRSPRTKQLNWKVRPETYEKMLRIWDERDADYGDEVLAYLISLHEAQDQT